MIDKVKPKGLWARLCFSFFGAWFLIWERIKGASSVVEIIHPTRLEPKMVATSLAGYELSVYCRARHYERTYLRWFARPKYYVVYQVYSIASSDAPRELKSACENCMTIPASMHWSVADEAQEKAAIDSYLDILIGRLQPTMSRAQPA